MSFAGSLCLMTKCGYIWKKMQLLGCKLELHFVCVVMHSNSHVSCKIMLILWTDDTNQYIVFKSFWKLKLFPFREFISYKCHTGILLNINLIQKVI